MPFHIKSAHNGRKPKGVGWRRLGQAAGRSGLEAHAHHVIHDFEDDALGVGQCAAGNSGEGFGKLCLYEFGVHRHLN